MCLTKRFCTEVQDQYVHHYFKIGGVSWTKNGYSRAAPFFKKNFALSIKNYLFVARTNTYSPAEFWRILGGPGT